MKELHHWDWETPERPNANLREAVAVFSSERDMQEAVDDLESHGFSNAAISRPVTPEKIEQQLQHPVRSVQELEDDPMVPREAYIDPDSRTSGMMVALLIPTYVLLLAGLGIAASYGMATWQVVFLTLASGVIGAAVGGLIAYRIFQNSDRRLALEKKLGGFLLWVRTGSELQEREAIGILRKHDAFDVHMHGAA